MRAAFQGFALIDNPHPNPLPQAGEGAKSATQATNMSALLSSFSTAASLAFPAPLPKKGGSRSGIKTLTLWFLLFVGSLWAGAQNALAGGGSFITLPALMLTGMDARAANITSCVALFPAQIVTGLTGRSQMEAQRGLSVKALVLISLAGGAVGAVILLATPSSVFAKLVPWLVLFATAVFGWGSFL